MNRTFHIQKKQEEKDNQYKLKEAMAIAIGLIKHDWPLHEADHHKVPTMRLTFFQPHSCNGLQIQDYDIVACQAHVLLTLNKSFLNLKS